MTANRFYAATSIFLVAVLGYLTYRILHPFLNSIAWAVVFSIVFFPVYVFLTKSLRFKTLASILTVVMVILLVLGPFTYLSFILIDEIGNFTESINKGMLDSARDFVTESKIMKLVYRIQSSLGIEIIGNSDTFSESLKDIGKNVKGALSSGIANIADVIIDFLFMLLAVFFFLRDGPDFLSRIRDYLPFSEEDKNRLFSKTKDMVISTVYGGVVVAVVQGFIGGVTFSLLGIASPVLWGAAISIMSFLPVLGTFSIWGPMTVYLFVQGLYAKGFILLLVGFFGISMVDNVLKPIIISGRTKMPALAVFFSVLGGIKLFGFVGFIMGPLVLALFLSVFEIFRHIEGGEHA